MKSRKFYELSIIGVMFLFVILPVKVSAYTYKYGEAKAEISGSTCFDTKIFTNPTIVRSEDNLDTPDYTNPLYGIGGYQSGYKNPSYKRNPFSPGTANYIVVTSKENCSGQWRTFDEACRDYDKVSLVEPFSSSKSLRSSFTSVCKGLGYTDIVDYTGITASTCYNIEYLINGKSGSSATAAESASRPTSGGSYSSGATVSCDRNFDYMCRNYDEVIKTEPILKNNADYQRKLKNVCTFIKYSLIDNSGDYSVVQNPSGDKIFNETNKCGGAKVEPGYNTGSNIRDVSSSKSYGELQKVFTHPGGHYNVQFSFEAHISINYYAYRTCSFVKYGNGQTGSCEEEGVSKTPETMGTASIPAGWDSHPSTVILTDKTDERKTQVTMTYESSDGCGGASGGNNVMTNPNPGGYTDATGTWVSGGQPPVLVYDKDGTIKEQVDEGDDKETYDLDSGAKSNGCSGSAPNKGETGVSSCGSCDANDGKWSLDKYECSAGYECNCSTCYDWSCTYKCSYTPMYRKHYATISENTCGVYKISQSSWETFDYEHRFDPINEKFVHSDTVVGDYLYYVTDRSGTDFGERSCDLFVRDGKTPPGDHWSDLIYYRNVDEKNIFPGNRKRGHNWSIYDSNALKHIVSNQTEPMYVITLSASAMRKVATNTTLEDYIGWGKLLKETYNPIGEDGKYNRNGDYINSFEELIKAGVIIKRNDSVIKARNDYLLEHGFNKYSKSLGGV